MVSPLWGIALSFAVATIPFVMLFIVPRNREPGSAIAWLLIIAIFPVAGLILFWILGNPRLPRARRRKQAATEAVIREAVEAARAQGDLHTIEPEHAELAHLVERLGGLPATDGNSVHVIHDYNDAINQIAKAIGDATQYVHLQYYILAMDKTTEPVFRAMEDAAARGVTVRVLFDHIGSRGYPRHGKMLRRMRDAGIEWRRMLPFQPWFGRISRPDLRNHRKIVVVDGRDAFAGSQNMIDRSYLVRKNVRKGLQYEEVIFHAKGGMSLALDTVFRMDWFAEANQEMVAAHHPGTHGGVVAQILPSGPGLNQQNNLFLFNQLAYRAKKRITLVNPYFVPETSLVEALETAAHRGVKVTLVTCAEGDHKLLDHAQRSYYEVLLKAGVNIALLPPPALLHSKTVTVDDDIAIIGSSNLDMRSFNLNMEVTTIFYSAEVNQSVQRVEQAYLAQCSRLDYKQWLRRPLPGQILDSVARLTAHVQ